jgi:hypothetical protein
MPRRAVARGSVWPGPDNTRVRLRVRGARHVAANVSERSGLSPRLYFGLPRPCIDRHRIGRPVKWRPKRIPFSHDFMFSRTVRIRLARSGRADVTGARKSATTVVAWQARTPDMDRSAMSHGAIREQVGGATVGLRGACKRAEADRLGTRSYRRTCSVKGRSSASSLEGGQKLLKRQWCRVGYRF